MLRVFGDSRSGNCYKIKLLLHQLETPYEWVDVDILAGGSRSETFLAKNPNGRVPVLQIGEDTYLWESNAILYYLSQGSEFWPADRLHQARVLQWLCFEQYSHEPFIATSRFIIQYLKRPADREQELAAKKKGGYAALDVMERHLGAHRYFAVERYTIADIALYAYTHVAAEGDFDLSRFTAIRAWLARIESQPGYVGMHDDASPGEPCQ